MANPFGQVDATFGVDIGFYVFQLPFLTAALAWLFSAVLVILFAGAAAHVLNGGIRLHAPRDRATPQVKAHLSVLLALLALVTLALKTLIEFRNKQHQKQRGFE